MLYENLKLLHTGFAIVSVSGFILRGIWMLNDSALLQARLSRVLPHIIDTFLLLTAIALVYVVPWNIMTNEWLHAKIIALIVYIVLGSYALKRGRTRRSRLLFWLLALLVFAYMVSVAVTKSHYGALLWF